MMPSPLFPSFNRVTKQSAALQKFQSTPFGKAIVKSSQRNGGRVPQHELEQIVKQMGGSVDRYSRSKIIDTLTSKLGAFGSMLGSLLRPTGRALGTPQQELEAAKHLLETFGYGVKTPEQVFEEKKKPKPESVHNRPHVHVGQRKPQPGDAQQQFDDGPTGPPGKPLTQGMIPVTSSNVHSIGYEYAAVDGQPGNLLVRFLGGTGKERGGEGALYRYRDVPLSVFISFKLASSKGKFVWDELRVRHTVSGHQYDYELAGTGATDYIPRQAGMKRGMAGEYYLQRSFQGRTSQRPQRAIGGRSQQLQGWEKINQMKLRAGRRP